MVSWRACDERKPNTNQRYYRLAGNLNVLEASQNVNLAVRQDHSRPARVYHTVNVSM
jgi:hypothetical protein